MKALPIAVVLILALLIAGVLLYQRAMQNEQAVLSQEEQSPDGSAVEEVEVGGEKMVLVPSSQSNARVNATGLGSEGSEDMRHLLETPTRTKEVKAVASGKGYRPDDAIDWIVDIEFDGSPTLQRTAILEIFSSEWLKNNGNPDIYGWSPEDKQWTFLRAGGVPETYTKIALGWSLFDPLDQETFVATVEDLNAHKDSVSEVAKSFGAAALHWNRSPDEAVKVATSINRAVESCDRNVVVVLAAPDGKTFAGREIWDVMLCIGLRWGDMDLFHWENANGLVGDDFYFSVWTSTAPGYFLPEEIAAGRVQVQNLVFGYSIPRSADPKSVFKSMMKAVKYAQQRLGGEILDRQGQPLNESAFAEEIEGTVQELTDAGFTPGEGMTLRVF